MGGRHLHSLDTSIPILRSRRYFLAKMRDAKATSFRIKYLKSKGIVHDSAQSPCPVLTSRCALGAQRSQHQVMLHRWLPCCHADVLHHRHPGRVAFASWPDDS